MLHRHRTPRPTVRWAVELLIEGRWKALQSMGKAVTIWCPGQKPEKARAFDHLGTHYHDLWLAGDLRFAPLKGLL